MVCLRVAVLGAALVGRSWVGFITLNVFALLFGLTFAYPHRALAEEVKPGEKITTANAYKVKDLVSPGNYWKVANGMTMEIAPTEHLDWPPPYREATEKYSAQVQLSQDR
ncbi:MAG: hypothetical protein ACREQB_03120, partial [Candidatus Binataceae bacterium]